MSMSTTQINHTIVENLTDGAHVGHDRPDGPKEGGVVSPANVFVLSH